MPTTRISARVSAIAESATLAVDAKAKALKAAGRPVIGFGAGEPDFPTPDYIVEAAKRAAADPRMHKYTPAAGLPELREAIAVKTARDSGYQVKASQVLVTNGGKQAVYQTFATLLNPGDEALLPAPYWTTYHDIADIVGARVNVLPCPSVQNYKLAPAQLEAALQRKPKMFLFNNPSNPTGMVYTREEIAALADVLAKYPDTWIVTDDIYNSMVFEGIGYHNFVLEKPELRERLIFIDSVSKTYGMPGWRVGLIAGPESVAKAVTTLNSNHITSLPEVITAAAIAAFSGPQDIPQAKCAEFAGKRDVVVDALRAIPGVICPRPQGAFYAFPDISVAFGKRHNGTLISNDVEFCAALLEAKGVACVPGSAFGEPRALRISYTCPTAQLEPGLQRIQQFFAELV